MTDTPLWSPSPEKIQGSIAYAFMQAVNQKFSMKLETYQALHQWSITNREQFWAFWAEYSHFPFITPYSSVANNIDTIEETHWFPDAKINYAQKILDFKGNQPAIIAYNEKQSRREVSRNQLYELVARLASKLKQVGIKTGDRVAGYMPNTIETMVMMLACASIGAIWSSCSPDFGVEGVVDRFGQIQPKLLITVDGYHYAGKQYNIIDKVKASIKLIPSISTLIIVPFLNNTFNTSTFSQTGVETVLWDAFIEAEKQAVPPLYITPLPFNHPLYILYSSGTTGVPKCIVHGHGGSLIQHMKEHQLHTNIKKGDRVFYFTTCGWMMWNWLASTLASGACAVLYDGSPFHPGPETLWQLTEREQVNVFGTSAKYLSALSKAHYFPEQHHNLQSLNTLLSTGSPLSPDDFDYVYRHIKPDLCLSSISGGTDIVSCFVLGSPLLPVYKGQIQCQGLGMDVRFVNEEGQEKIGVKGELVCKQSFPSMPVGFWNDSTGEKYHNAYFCRFQNIWAHGDYGEITPEGGIILHGRSDTTLNPGGVRIGTAEIYRQVDKLTAIRESLAVGQQWQGDERIILFVILQPGYRLDEELKSNIRHTLRKNTSPRHVPEKIIQVEDFPRTRSGKVSEAAVKATIHHEAVPNTHALVNADVLASFQMLTDLES